MVFFNTSKWQEWRDRYVWTLEINDILHANLESLKKIYKSFHTSKKNFMDLSDALNLLVRNTNILPNEKEVVFCFGMCQCTITNEITKRNIYNNLSFVEFLEFICRAAEMYHKAVKTQVKEEEKAGKENSEDGQIEETEISLKHSTTRKFSSTSLNSTLKLPQNVGLDAKLEFLLDRLFLIYNFKRKEVKIEIEFDTDSDSDY
jgi:hypothetical protein